MFRYHEGETVAVRQDWPELGLKAGDTGKIWALYTLESPSYEVNFETADGETFDLTLSEEEISPVARPARPARKRPDRRVKAA